MSLNISRAEKSEGVKRPGRSGSSGQHRGFSGGGGKGGGNAPPLSSTTSSGAPSAAALSANRSFKKSGNGQGGASRVNPTASSSDPSVAAGTAHRAVQNGAHAPAPVHGSSNVPSPSGSKPVDMPVPRNSSRALPRAPTSQSPAAFDTSAPSAPPQGDASRAFTLQFGTINPGIMNGMQIPARTSSAPPNLDEQKRDQARHDSFRTVPTVPLSAAPKQHQNQTRKDAGGANQSNTSESHPPAQTKRDVHVPAPLAPTAVPPKTSVHPMSGMPMPIPFQHQQPQVPLQFGGPNHQIQSQGVAASSLQMTMALPVGNAPQVPQQMFVPGIQTHPLQQQAMLHQGQSLGFAPPMGHQLPPQLGNLGMGITSQFPQQQPGKFGGPRKTTVKITHPDTHEELRLDKRTDSYADSASSGQRPHPNVTQQSQPIPTFNPSHQINYYPSLQPNTYNSSPIFFPTTSVSLTSTQMPTGSQASRYTYQVGQGAQPLSFMNPSILNPMPGGKPGPPTSLHGVSEGVHLEGLSVSAASAPFQVTVKPPVASRVEKVGAPSGTPSVIISMPSSKSEPPKVLKPTGDAILSHQQKGSEIGPESSIQQAKSVLESSGNVSPPETDARSTVVPPISSSHRPQPETASSVSVSSTGDSISVSAGNDSRKREPVRRSESLKDQSKKLSKKDLRHLQQQHQSDALDSADGAKVSALKISMDSSATDILTEQVPRSTESAQVPSVSDSITSSTSLLTPGIDNKIPSEIGAFDNVEDRTMPTGPGTSGLTSEKDASQNAPTNCSDAVESAAGGLSVKDGGPFETPTSLCPGLDRAVPKALDTSVSQDTMSAEFGERPEMQPAVEYLNTEVSNDSLQDLNNAVVSSISVKESSEDTNAIGPIKVRDAVVENFEKTFEYDGEKQPDESSKDTVVCRLEVDRTTEGVDCTPTMSSNLIEAESVSTSHLPTAFDERTNNSEGTGSQDVGFKHPGTSTLAAIPVADSAVSEAIEKLEVKVLDSSTGRPSSPMLSGHKEKPSLEGTKPKATAGKKKKRKEILSKADAAGASDLYNAYKGPEEKHESIITSESVDSSTTSDAKHVPMEDPDKAVVAIEEDAQSKAELDDWEDAADISTPKLRTPEHGQQINGAKKQHGEDGTDASGRKKYSRDFLLTYQNQCTDLPVCFEIGSDIADALMSVPVGKSYVVERDPYPSPGRIIDRPSGASRIDRRMAGITEDDKWTKSASFGPGRDLRMDVGHGPAVVSFRPGQGANHGVLRNPRGQAAHQFSGGILSGPMQSLASQGGVSRNGPDADRWQRAPGIQRGLIPSPQTPLQVMHKAEKKYEVGKISDEEVGKQRRLKGILNKLTPQNFDKLFQQVKEVNIDNTVTLTGVISQIFDKALMEPTFCEMYANFCFHLAGALPDFEEDNEKITFKRLLLNKCQEEFERGEREEAEANKTEEEGEIKQSAEEREEKRVRARRRMLGNIRLIGELYKKRMLTERIMHECIKKLLVDQYADPDEEDVEALCKLMSTIGEMIDHPKAKEHMDAYFDMMLKLSTNPKLSSRVRFMLKDSIDLRRNKWQQRRKVEGPKKIDEVHRDAAHERHTQTRGLARGPVISSGRRGAPVDYGPRGSSTLTSSTPPQAGGVRGISPQVRGFGAQDVRMDDRHQFESRTLSLPLPQRIDDITLGPQGGLARGMSIRGQPLMSTMPLNETPQTVGDRRMASGPNGSVPDWTPHNSREETTSRSVADRLPGAPYDQPGTQDRKSYFGSKDTRTADHALSRSMTAILPAGRNPGSSTISQTAPSEMRTFSEDVLREKSMSAIREFYSAKDEKEVALCIKELNDPSFYPLMVSLWVTDSFEKKDMERDLLAKLLVSLSKPGESLLSQGQLIQGFESVLSSLEDAVNDAPRAAEFLGRIFAKAIVENLVSLKEIGRLVHEGGEEPGRLREIGLAADVLGSILESIRNEKGDPILNEICASSSLRLEDFRPPHPLKSKKLDAFL